MARERVQFQPVLLSSTVTHASICFCKGALSKMPPQGRPLRRQRWLFDFYGMKSLGLLGADCRPRLRCPWSRLPLAGRLTKTRLCRPSRPGHAGYHSRSDHPPDRSCGRRSMTGAGHESPAAPTPPARAKQEYETRGMNGVGRRWGSSASHSTPMSVPDAEPGGSAASGKDQQRLDGNESWR